MRCWGKSKTVKVLAVLLAGLLVFTNISITAYAEDDVSEVTQTVDSETIDAENTEVEASYDSTDALDLLQSDTIAEEPVQVEEESMSVEIIDDTDVEQPMNVIDVNDGNTIDTAEGNSEMLPEEKETAEEASLEACEDLIDEQVATDEASEAFDYSDVVSGYYVNIHAPEGVFPTGTTVSVCIVDNDLELVKSILGEDKEIRQIRTFDISFWLEGTEIEPENGSVDVSIGLDSEMKDSLSDEQTSCQVFHVEDDGNIEEVSCSTDENSVFFEASAFSEYVITSTAYITGLTNAGYKEIRGFTEAEGTELDLPDDILIIGDHAFENYGARLTAVNLNRIISIGKYAFAGTDIKEITMGYNKKPKDYAFANCDKLETVNNVDFATFMPVDRTGRILDIPSHVFANCVNLSSVTFLSSAINDYAFSGCSNLKYVCFRETYTGHVGVSAFENSGLNSIYVCKSFSAFDDRAFENCTSLTDIYYGGTEAEWESISFGDFVFKGCGNITVHFNVPGTMVPVASRTPVILNNIDNLPSKLVHVGDTVPQPESPEEDGTGEETPEAPKIVLSSTEVTMDPNQVFKLTATVTPEIDDYSIVSWSSSDNSTVFVESRDTGKFIPVQSRKEGTAVITATLNDGSGISATCTVHVNPNAETTSPSEQENEFEPYQIGSGGGFRGNDSSNSGSNNSTDPNHEFFDGLKTQLTVGANTESVEIDLGGYNIISKDFAESIKNSKADEVRIKYKLNGNYKTVVIAGETKSHLTDPEFIGTDGWIHFNALQTPLLSDAQLEIKEKLDGIFKEWDGKNFQESYDGSWGCDAFTRYAYQTLYKTRRPKANILNIPITDTAAIIAKLHVGDAMWLECGNQTHSFIVAGWDKYGITVYEATGVESGNVVRKHTYPWSGGKGLNSSLANYFGNNRGKIDIYHHVGYPED